MDFMIELQRLYEFLIEHIFASSNIMIYCEACNLPKALRICHNSIIVAFALVIIYEYELDIVILKHIAIVVYEEKFYIIIKS